MYNVQQLDYFQLSLSSSPLLRAREMQLKSCLGSVKIFVLLHEQAPLLTISLLCTSGLVEFATVH